IETHVARSASLHPHGRDGPGPSWRADFTNHRPWGTCRGDKCQSTIAVPLRSRPSKDDRSDLSCRRPSEDDRSAPFAAARKGSRSAAPAVQDAEAAKRKLHGEKPALSSTIYRYPQTREFADASRTGDRAIGSTPRPSTL